MAEGSRISHTGETLLIGIGRRSAVSRAGDRHRTYAFRRPPNGSIVHLHASFTHHEATRRGSCRA
jgi:hypothetical protein